MIVSVVKGDVFEVSGDVLICPGNPWLNMSGGVNGEILLRCGPKIQTELHQHLVSRSLEQVPPGTVVVTESDKLNFKHLVHAVAIDVFYDTSTEIVTKTLCAAWEQAAHLGQYVVMPAIATGYGRLPLEEFGKAFSDAVALSSGINMQLTLILRSQEHCDAVRTQLSATSVDQ